MDARKSMKVKEINFSDFTYKRICVYDANRTFYPVGYENLVLAKHGEKELASFPETDEYGWLEILLEDYVPA